MDRDKFVFRIKKYLIETCEYDDTEIIYLEAIRNYANARLHEKGIKGHVDIAIIKAKEII